MTDLPAKMTGVLMTGHGGPEKLEYRTDIPLPKIGNRDVLIRVGAAGVNNTDINTRIGWYAKTEGNTEDASWSGEALKFPRIQGADVAGKIVAVGSEVNESRIGDRVLIEPCLTEVDGQRPPHPWYFGSECNGGFAQFTVVADGHACKIDSDYSDVELASFPCSYSTAENMLTRTSTAAGDRVLVTGASGGVGSAAVQLAKARGAEVVAVTSPAKSEELIALGATQTIGRNENLRDALGENSIDVVIDLVAGPTWPNLLNILRPFGRYAVAGAIAGPLVELDVRTLYLKDLSFFGCTVLAPNVFGNLIHLIETGAIKPLVAEVFPLAKINEAQSVFQTKKHTGKIVLQIPD
ncbi:alcohol dehydrogenase family protein [Sneathiella marina]|uniref:Alcohol dehydrogenase family protein n=1 Tax=Sneathiella marina TaxID=2950108 RepID=A0ABY4W9T8_9PROT|nr:alcohol dehydrogenase family protein [Sneathiella marina]USG62903.1 alcohol dehydrogenase family protein [Sneathiella marina]